jgi:hypothetical protein
METPRSDTSISRAWYSTPPRRWSLRTRATILWARSSDRLQCSCWQDRSPSLQIPAAAVAGALVALHRQGDSAWTKFTDHKGQTWEIHLLRENGRWRITEVKDAKVLLQKLQEHEAKQLNPGP